MVQHADSYYEPWRMVKFANHKETCEVQAILGRCVTSCRLGLDTNRTVAKLVSGQAVEFVLGEEFEYVHLDDYSPHCPLHPHDSIIRGL